MKDKASYSSPGELNHFGFHEYGYREQWDFSVVCVDDNFWEIYQDKHSYNPFEDDEQEEYQKRRSEMVRLINKSAERLTKRQKQVLELYLQDKTQQEIADELGITQSTVQVAIHGRLDFKTRKKYGGIIKTLKRLIKKQGGPFEIK